jgi:toxin YoeB
MELVMEDRAFQELAYWVKNDRRVALKIIDLIEQTKREPFAGIGKPEPLKYDRKGCWSRRITQEHRLVYIVTDETIIVISCKGHYEE